MVVEINLLPWRQLAREQYKKNVHRILTGTIILLIIIFCITHYVLTYKISQENIKIAYWHRQLAQIANHSEAIKTLQYQLNKYHIITQLIKRIDKNQNVSLEVFKKIIDNTTPEIVFSEMVSLGPKIFLSGKSYSVTAISQLINSFNASKNLHKAQIVEIKKQPKTGQLIFHIELWQDVLTIFNEGHK